MQSNSGYQKQQRTNKQQPKQAAKRGKQWQRQDKRQQWLAI